MMTLATVRDADEQIALFERLLDCCDAESVSCIEEVLIEAHEVRLRMIEKGQLTWN